MMTRHAARRHRSFWAATLALAGVTALSTVACARPNGTAPGTTPTTRRPAAGGDHGGAGAHAGMTIPARLDHDPTPEQKLAAEKLVADTREAVKRNHLLTPQDAIKAGYNPIGDEMTGTAHYTNAVFRHDGHQLDPDRIETLVYKPGTGQLMAAMYNMEPETTWDTVPDIAGNWTVYHDHDNLCWQSDVEGTPGYTRLGGAVVNGTCTSGFRHDPVLMIHVWIIDNPCGPFSGTDPGDRTGSCLKEPV